MKAKVAQLCLALCSSLPRLWHCRQMLYHLSRQGNGKESACSAGNLGSIPELGRPPGEGNGESLLSPYSYLENSMDRGAWQAAVHVVTEPDVTE